MEIKPIPEEDLDQLATLYEQLVEEKSDPAVLQAVYRETCQEPHYFLFGAYEGPRLLGTFCLTRCFDLTGDCRYYYNMENFVVDQNTRHLGVGRTLLSYAETFVQQSGGSYINFTSSSSRKAAHQFYAACGYDPEAVKGFKKSFS